MLRVYAGRFPYQMKDVIPFAMADWDTTETQVKSRNAPFAIDLETNHVTFVDRESDAITTLPIEWAQDVDFIRLDCPQMLDFWMELKRI